MERGAKTNKRDKMIAIAPSDIWWKGKKLFIRIPDDRTLVITNPEITLNPKGDLSKLTVIAKQKEIK